MNRNFWRGKRVLVTGHTGFKGSWLSIWLNELGAKVAGLAQPPTSQPNLFDVTGVERAVASSLADINDASAVERVFNEHQPEIVFHLAAQALVRASYQDPVGTFATNVGGVITLLDTVRRSPSVKAVVVVTSDKCYENLEWEWGYREIDRLGGRDPYSASKGCAEIAARSMQLSYFAPYAPNGHHARIATVRAGNVIGGGDWSEDRLVPDIVRGCLGSAGEVRLRNPRAVRPWQHVLEPLAAYFLIAEKLVNSPDGMDDAWNIGPEAGDTRAVLDVAEAIVRALGQGRIIDASSQQGPHEANLLTLDCAKAKAKLGWKPRLRFDDAIRMTADWYAAWNEGHDMVAFTRRQIAAFENINRDSLATSLA